MSYSFIANKANAELLARLRTQYYKSHAFYIEEITRIKSIPSHTEAELSKAKNNAYHCALIYNKLTEIYNHPVITSAKLSAFKAFFRRYSNPLLLNLLNTAFAPACPSWTFIANTENITLLSQLCKKYQGLFLKHQDEADRKSISPDCTQEDYIEERNTAFTYNSVRVELFKIRNNNVISSAKMNDLQKLFQRYNDQELQKLLSDTFRPITDSQLSARRPLMFSSYFKQQQLSPLAQRLGRTPYKQSRHSPSGVENASTSSNIDSLSNQMSDTLSLRKSPKLTPT